MGEVTTQDLFTVAIIAGLVVAGGIYGAGYYWSAGFMAASFVAGKLLAPTEQSLVTNAAGRNVNVRSSIETRKIIYGTSAIGGTIVYATSSGKKHQMLHLVIVLADHESEDIEKVYFNEEDSNSATFHRKLKENARIWFNPPKIKSNGETKDDNVKLDNYGYNDRGIFVDFSGSNDPTYTNHGYYYGTRSEDTDVHRSYLKVDKVTGGEFTAAEIHDYFEFTGAQPDLYASYRRLNKHLGTPDQVADADLIQDDPTGPWDETCTLSGITYIVASLLFDTNKYPTGIPNVLSVVKGKKIYDPRLDSNIAGGSGPHRFNDPSTWEWEGYTDGEGNVKRIGDNWALCVLDYLKGRPPNLVEGAVYYPDYGLGLDIDDIDWNSVVTSANICDEYVQIDPTADIWRHRYSMNGVVDSGASFASNMESMLTAAEGHIAFTQGTYKIFAGAYNAPSGPILDEKDLSSDLQVRASTPRSELFNVVSGIFIDKDSLYVGTSFPRFPPIDSRNIYEEEDGREIVREIELPYTTDVYQAQMLAKIVLESSRQNIVVSFPANIKALNYALWDVILIGAKSLGWGPLDKEETISNISYSPTEDIYLTNTFYDTNSLIGKSVINNSIDISSTNRQATIVSNFDNVITVTDSNIDGSGLGGERWLISHNITILQDSNPYKEFRITNIEIAPTGQVTMAMKEEVKAMYNWDITKVTEVDPAPNTGLPSPLETFPPVITDIDTTEIFKGIDGTIQASIRIKWEDASNYTSFYEVEFKKALSLDEEIQWTAYGSVSIPNVSITPVVTDDTYFVRIRSVSSIGVRSDWAISEKITIEGEKAPPSEVQSFTVRSQADGTREYTWVHTTKELDVVGYVIKYILQNNLPVDYDLQDLWKGLYENNKMTALHVGYITESPFELNRPDAGDYVFAIAAIDASDIEGPAVEYRISLPDPRTKNSIFSSDEALREGGFPGYKVNCYTTERKLYPNTTSAAWPATWDAITRWNSGALETNFTYWTGDTYLVNSTDPSTYAGAIDLEANITFTPNMTTNTIGINDSVTAITWHYLKDEQNAVWESTTELYSVITARWIKAKVDFTVNEPEAQVNEISIELTGDLLDETININMEDWRTKPEYQYLFPLHPLGPGLINLPYTRDFKYITHVSVSVIGSTEATSFVVVNKNLATHATEPGPRVQVYQWNDTNKTFDAKDMEIDVRIRGV